MSISFLIQLLLALLLLLGFLIFFLFIRPKKKLESEQKEKVKHINVTHKPTFNSLVEIIRNKNATNKELKEALDLIIEFYGNIHPKLGSRTHPDFDVYGEIVLRICRHPNTSTELILAFDRKLEKKNGEYVKEINDFLKKGLDSRGL